MTQITLKGKPINTSGQMPALKSQAKDFTLVDKDLNNKTLKDFKGKKKVIATVPSLDTGVCSLMTKHLNDLSKKFPNSVFITISADLPFAQNRFCQAEGVQNVQTLSMMRSKDFGKDYGLLIIDGPLSGVLARSVFVLDEQDRVVYTQLVPEIAQEPDFTPIPKYL